MNCHEQYFASTLRQKKHVRHVEYESLKVETALIYDGNKYKYYPKYDMFSFTYSGHTK